MERINLKDYYPWYADNEYIMVPRDISIALFTAKQQERAYIRRIVRNKAHFSLNCNDGIELDACLSVPDPHTALEKAEEHCLLQKALLSLPALQRRRTIMYFFFRMTMKEIAQVEGISTAAAHSAIHRGLIGIKKFLIKNNYPG